MFCSHRGCVREGQNVLAGRRASPIALLAPHTLYEVADVFPSVSPAQPRGSVWKPHITALLSSAPTLGCFADLLRFTWVGHALESAPSPFVTPSHLHAQRWDVHPECTAGPGAQPAASSVSSARFCSAQLSLSQLILARLDSDRIGSARLISARLLSAPLSGTAGAVRGAETLPPGAGEWLGLGHAPPGEEGCPQWDPSSCSPISSRLGRTSQALSGSARRKLKEWR